MQLIIAFACLAVACVFGATDPTKVCLPEVFESDLYSATNDDYGRLAIDFKRERIAISYVRSGVRIVLNLTNYEGNAINVTDGSCRQILAGSNIRNVVTRCLPATARLLVNTTSSIGVAPNSVTFQAYEIDVGNDVTRVALTTGKEALPVIREYRSGNTTDVAFYSNQRLSISDERIFDVPDNCEPSVVVG